jgi:hypothetical protein
MKTGFALDFLRHLSGATTKKAPGGIILRGPRALTLHRRLGYPLPKLRPRRAGLRFAK